MEITTIIPEIMESSELITQETFSYRQSLELNEEMIWRNLAGRTLRQAAETWLKTLSGLTQKNYACAIRKLNELKLINLNMSLQKFSLINHNDIIDQVKRIPGSESTRQARAACYISLTRFINRKTEGIVRVATPCREGALNTTKTFGSVRSKVKTEALEPMEWIRLIDAIEKPNEKLVVKLMLQGAKRIGEVLSLTIDKVDFNKRQAQMKQLKTRDEENWLVVNLPENLATELERFIGERKSGLVFQIEKRVKGNPELKPIQHMQVYRAMKKAAVAAGIKKNVHPHVMRASAITHHRGQGVSDADLSRLTGQTLQMMARYDKTAQEDNASRVALV